MVNDVAITTSKWVLMARNQISKRANTQKLRLYFISSTLVVKMIYMPLKQ